MQLRPADNARAGTICRGYASTSLRLYDSTRSSPPLTSHRASPRASGFVHMLQCAAQVLLCCVISYSTLWRPVPWRLRNNGHRAWGVGISRPCSRAAAEEVGLLPVPLRGWLLWHGAWGVGISRPCSRATAEGVGSLPSASSWRMRSGQGAAMAPAFSLLR